jgi:hypothetical protein
MAKYLLIELQHKFNQNPYDVECGNTLFETQLANQLIPQALETLSKVLYHRAPTSE